MPANKKYLTQSTPRKIFRLSAGLLGGYFVTVSFFGLLSKIFEPAATMISLRLFGFLLWCGLLINAYLMESPLRVWLLYLGIGAFFILTTVYILS